MDDTTDELERRLFRHVLEVDGGTPVDEPRSTRAVQLALVARHYERIGDHAVTIAEQVHFVATGEHTPHRRGSGDELDRAGSSSERRQSVGPGRGDFPAPHSPLTLLSATHSQP